MRGGSDGTRGRGAPALTVVAAASVFLSGCSGGGAAGDSSRALYKERCAVCHGEDGLGRQVGEMRAQSLKSESAVGLTDDAIFTRVKRGSGDMPSFAATLTDEQIRGLVRHVRTNIQGL